MKRVVWEKDERTFWIPAPTSGPKINSKGTFSIPTMLTFARLLVARAASIPMKEDPTMTTFFLTSGSDPRAARKRMS